MRVLFLSTWFPFPPDNGSKLRVYHLLRALGQTHEVWLLSFAFDTALPTDPGPLGHWCTHVETVELDPFAFNRAGALATFLSSSPLAARPVPAMSQRVAQVMRDQTFDAIIASTEVTASYALSAPATTVKILEEHNSLTRWMYGRYANQSQALQKLRCRISWQKTRYYEARLFRQFDLVTMVSEQDKAVCLTDLPGYRGRVAIVPNGVDCEHNRPALIPPQPNTLVYNGSLTYSANYDAMQWFLAEVYPRIRQSVPSASLTITGSTKGVDLPGLALDNTVRLTGFVNDVRLPVSEAAICVAPIRQGGGTRLKILEAMALGTPVIATSKGAEGLEIRHKENILIADTAEAFAAQTARLLRDEPERRRLASNARELVEQRYDWSQIGCRFVALVEEAARRRGGSQYEPL